MICRNLNINVRRMLFRQPFIFFSVESHGKSFQDNRYKSFLGPLLVSLPCCQNCQNVIQYIEHFFFEKDSCLNLIHVGTVDEHIHVCVDKICFLWIFKLYIACILCITVSVIIKNSHISYIFIV